MKKIKENRVVVVVSIFGIIIMAILVAILQQQKGNSPVVQEARYSESIEKSRKVASDQDVANEKLYTKKAAKMKGHVYDMGGSVYITSWSKTDLINWAKDYSNLPESDKYMANTNFGTSRTVSNDRLDKSALDVIAEAILDGDFKSIGYYNTVKEFNQNPANSGFNPDDIIK